MTSANEHEAILNRLSRLGNQIETMYEDASFGSHTLKADGTFASVNGVELAWLGCTREELIGKRSPADFLTLESLTQLQRQLDTHGRHGFMDLELVLVNRRQEQRLISMSFNGSRSEDGTASTGRYVLFDLTHVQTDRKQQRIAAISFESLCGICVTDTSGTILRVNGGFTTLTGYTNHEVVGKNMRILNAGIQTADFYSTMWASIATLGYWQGEIRNRRNDGRIITEWLSIAAVKDADGTVTNYVGTFYDISAAKLSQDEVTQMAFHDTLTQLPNRRLLQQRIEHALALAGRNNLQSAMLFVDLDHFKSINDTRGHDAGDLLLIEVGRRMQAALRAGDTVARVGGDEFVVLLEGMDGDVSNPKDQARQIGEKLLAALATPYRIKDFECRCTASIGVRMLGPGESAAQLLTHADFAMYQAKKEGRNALQFFDPEMQPKTPS